MTQTYTFLRTVEPALLDTSKWQPLPLAAERFLITPIVSRVPLALLSPGVTISHLYSKGRFHAGLCCSCFLGYSKDIPGKQLWLNKELCLRHRNTNQETDRGATEEQRKVCVCGKHWVWETTGIAPTQDSSENRRKLLDEAFYPL